MKGHILDYLKTSLVLIVLFFATVYIRFTYVNYNFPTDNSSNTNIVSKLENFFNEDLQRATIALCKTGTIKETDL